MTAIAFRSDNVPTMATASARGHVSVWDLNTKVWREMLTAQSVHK